MPRKALIWIGALVCILWFSTNGDAVLVEGKRLKHGIVHLKIVTFDDRGVGPAFVIALHSSGACQGETDTKLILDLRDNLGGFVDQAAAITAFFIKPSVIVELRMVMDGQESQRRYKTPETGPCAHARRVALVNKRTASASEIVAGVLQLNGTLLIGEDPHTFGKGIFEALAYNSQDILYQGRYYFANGEPLPPKGLTPTIVTGRGGVPEFGTPEYERFEETGLYDPRDLALERAIKYLLEK